MSTTFIDTVLCKAVSPSDSEYEEISIPNNAHLVLKIIEGSAVFNSEVKAELWWGSDVIFVTHGTLVSTIKRYYTGDGTKKLKLQLVNDSSSTETVEIGIKAHYHE